MFLLRIKDPNRINPWIEVGATSYDSVLEPSRIGVKTISRMNNLRYPQL